MTVFIYKAEQMSLFSDPALGGISELSQGQYSSAVCAREGGEKIQIRRTLSETSFYLNMMLFP